MALEAVVFPQDLFVGHGCKDWYNLAAALSQDFKLEKEEVGGEIDGFSLEKNQNIETLFDSFYGKWDSSSSSVVQTTKEWDPNSSPETCTVEGFFSESSPIPPPPPTTTATSCTRRKRRRTKSCKNKEEVENQRITHIVVERNRRKQMNDYLSVLRSLMPASYVQRGDQASIVGGAINFVKELEQLLQSLKAQKRMTQNPEAGFSSPFADFFSFPQYTCSTNRSSTNETVAENHSAIADIEVTMVESHANIKILSKRRPKQLLKMAAGFQNLHLTILHLNVTTIDEMVLYSFSVKVEDNCGLTSVDEIATAVYQMLGRIQEEAGIN